MFAQRMTEEARQLGLKKSTFKNATGFFHPEHLMTARELAMLARHIIRTYPDYYQLFALKEFPYRKHKFINRNPLLSLVAGVDGLKTGFIKEAGYGMVASAKQDSRRLIVVVNGLLHGRTSAGTRRAGCWSGASAISPRPSCSTPARWWATPACGAASACTCRSPATATSTSGCRAARPTRSSGRKSSTNGR